MAVHLSDYKISSYHKERHYHHSYQDIKHKAVNKHGVWYEQGDNYQTEDEDSWPLKNHCRHGKTHHRPYNYRQRMR